MAADDAPVPRILIVDDDRAVRTALQVNLRKVGYGVTAVENGRQALELLNSSPMDVVISDVAMPEMTGMELLGQVRHLI